LRYYRLQKIGEGAIKLEAGEGAELKGPTAVGTGAARKEEVELSRLITVLNERFGTDFKSADQLFFDSIREEAVADEGLRQVGEANTIDNFMPVFRKDLEGLIIDRLEQNEEIMARVMTCRSDKGLANVTLLCQRLCQPLGPVTRDVASGGGLGPFGLFTRNSRKPASKMPAGTPP
jgi:type I restriction enzyme R subunit